jgi:hypothetical protein
MQQHCVGRLHLKITWLTDSLAQMAWFAQYCPLVSSLYLDIEFQTAGLQAITAGIAAASR